jgi:hypothetical protein
VVETVLLRGLVQIAVALTIALAITLTLAALGALIGGGSFHSSLFAACMVVGCFCLLLAPAGQASGPWIIATGRIPNMPAWTHTPPGDTSISSAAVFAIAGALMIGLGFVIGR